MSGLTTHYSMRTGTRPIAPFKIEISSPSTLAIDQAHDNILLDTSVGSTGEHLENIVLEQSSANFYDGILPDGTISPPRDEDKLQNILTNNGNIVLYPNTTETNDVTKTQQNKCNIVDCFTGHYFCPGPNNYFDSASRSLGNFLTNFSPSLTDVSQKKLFEQDNDVFYFTAEHNYDLLICSYIIAQTDEVGQTAAEHINNHSSDRAGLSSAIAKVTFNYVWHQTVLETEHAINSDWYMTENPNVKAYYNHAVQILKEIVFTRVILSENFVWWKIKNEQNEYPWSIAQSYSSSKMIQILTRLDKNIKLGNLTNKKSNTQTQKNECGKGIEELFNKYKNKNPLFTPLQNAYIKAAGYALAKFVGDTSHIVFGRIILSIIDLISTNKPLANNIAQQFFNLKTMLSSSTLYPVNLTEFTNKITILEVNFFVSERPIVARLLLDSPQLKNCSVNIGYSTGFKIRELYTVCDYDDTYYLCVSFNEKVKARQTKKIIKDAIEWYTTWQHGTQATEGKGLLKELDAAAAAAAADAADPPAAAAAGPTYVTPPRPPDEARIGTFIKNYLYFKNLAKWTDLRQRYDIADLTTFSQMLSLKSTAVNPDAPVKSINKLVYLRLKQHWEDPEIRNIRELIGILGVINSTHYTELDIPDEFKNLVINLYNYLKDKTLDQLLAGFDGAPRVVFFAASERKSFGDPGETVVNELRSIITILGEKLSNPMPGGGTRPEGNILKTYKGGSPTESEITGIKMIKTTSEFYNDYDALMDKTTEDWPGEKNYKFFLYLKNKIGGLSRDSYVTINDTVIQISGLLGTAYFDDLLNDLLPRYYYSAEYTQIIKQHIIMGFVRLEDLGIPDVWKEGFAVEVAKQQEDEFKQLDSMQRKFWKEWEPQRLLLLREWEQQRQLKEKKEFRISRRNYLNRVDRANGAERPDKFKSQDWMLLGTVRSGKNLEKTEYLKQGRRSAHLMSRRGVGVHGGAKSKTRKKHRKQQSNRRKHPYKRRRKSNKKRPKNKTQKTNKKHRSIKSKLRIKKRTLKKRRR
jgi:hypothetical protein